MAEKKSASRAQKAVTDVKKKNAGAPVETVPKKGAVKKNPPKPVEDESTLPVRIIWAVACLGLFALFLFIGIKPEGALLKAIQPVLLGFVGKAAFLFSIPALLYMFIILVSSKDQPVTMRCSCLWAFVFICGCIYHMSVNNQTFVGGARIIADLWTGGAQGTSGGLLCGGFAMLIRWACGTVLTYLLFIIAGILTLLASMKITIPSIIRAIKNRPRDDWEDEDFVEVRPEPAALVVNHIANKRIEQNRQRRMQQEERQMTMDEVVVVNETPKSAKTSKRTLPTPEPTPEIAPPIVDEKTPEERRKIFSVIGNLEGGENSPPEEIFDTKNVPTKTAPVQSEEEDLIPALMPELKLDTPIPAGPKLKEPAPIAKEKVTAKDTARSAAQVAAEIEMGKAAQNAPYVYPPISLLKKPAGAAADGTGEMKENSRRLNETLESFRIDAHIINVTRGPSVTRYEVELDKGVRLNKLTTVADDIALSLGAPSVRIAPVPGKISVVGIEVPNRVVTTVSLREVIDSPEFNKSKSKSSFAVGKDIGGSCIIGNIAKMPHMLIAGTTGSGKSVCMNSIIISLLYKASPDEVKLIMVDPKMVELGIYNGIPHLLIPVVTDPKKAAGSLQWAVTEMLRRYKLMSEAGVRDLESYNQMVAGEEIEGEKLPQIVVIIDELADLMLVAAKEVEDSICRIAQMGRASGMHLIIATQRPSADVITGLMKANIPSRIAFSVASAMESRIILDTMGAEKLVGKGDMLYSPIGTGKPQRVQGCFVTDSEVEAVANYVKQHYVADYDQQVLEEIEKKAVQTGKKAATADPEPSTEELDGDELLPAAVDVILETGQASVSMLQRRLKLGYARAARIVDEMEEKGIVGPFQGSKPRSILITKEQWEAKKNGGEQLSLDELPFDEGVPEELL